MHAADMAERARPGTAAPTGTRRPLLGPRRALLVAGLALLIATLAVPVVLTRADRPEALSFTELLHAVESGEVASLTVRPGDRIVGEWTAVPGTAGFTVDFPLDRSDLLLERAERAGVDVRFERAASPDRIRQTAGLVLFVLILGALGYVILVNLRGGASGGVGRRAGETRTRFSNVAGTQGAVEELKELVEFLRDPAAFSVMGARVPKGVLLSGKPGTGKTLLARAVAGEAGVPFYHLSGSEVTGFIVGLGAQRIRSLFRKARKKGGVIFVDEIDSLGGRRGRDRSHNEDDRTLNQLLVELDGFSPSDGVVVIGATNRPEDLDPALTRPGRFDRMVTVPLPSADGRAEILRLHVVDRRIPLDADADLHRLARLLPGSSGAELAALLNEAAIAAVRDGADRVGWRHFESARDRMLLGKERVGFRAREQELRIVAYHEAGHALAGVVVCPEDGLHKVTIQPRGRAMGVAHFSPEDDRHLHSRRYLEGQIIKGLAGRAAEELVFGSDQMTGGAESDLVQVNRIARRMVYRLGMGESTGFLVHDPDGPLSPSTQARMDDEVQALLDRQYARTLELVARYRAAIDALADALLDRETLDGAEAIAILGAQGVPTARPIPA